MTTKARTTLAQTTDAPVEEQSPKRTVVEYRHNYVFQSREITVQDLVKAYPELAEVEGLKLLRWSQDNNWQLDKAELDFLSPAQFDWLVGQDPDLEVREV